MITEQHELDAAYVVAARTRYASGSGGYDAHDIEIDDDARVSLGDDPGAFVQAWVWVRNEDLPEDIRKKYKLPKD